MKKIYNLLFLLVTILFLFFVLREVEYSKVYELLKTAKIGYFVLATLCMLISLLFWNLRWQNTMSNFQETNYFFLLITLFAGLFVNTITPGAGVGGEPLRAYLLKKKYGKTTGKFFAGIMADKLIYFLSHSIFLGVSLILAILFFNIPPALKLIFLGIFIITVAGLGIALYLSLRKEKKRNSKRKNYFSRYVFKKFEKIFRLKNYLKKGIRSILGIFRENIKDRKKLSKGIVYSFLLLMFKFISSYFLFLSLGFSVGIITVIVVFSISGLFGDISPIPGGIGIMEGVIFLLFSSQGIPPEISLSIALLNRTILLFYSLVVGGLCLIYSKWKII